MDVTVIVNPEHVRALREAREKLSLLAELGVNVGQLVDDLGELLDRAQAEQQQHHHSRRASLYIAPDVNGLELGSAKAWTERERGGV